MAQRAQLPGEGSDMGFKEPVACFVQLGETPGDAMQKVTDFETFCQDAKFRITLALFNFSETGPIYLPDSGSGAAAKAEKLICQAVIGVQDEAEAEPGGNEIGLPATVWCYGISLGGLIDLLVHEATHNGQPGDSALNNTGVRLLLEAEAIRESKFVLEFLYLYGAIEKDEFVVGLQKNIESAGSYLQVAHNAIDDAGPNPSDELTQALEELDSLASDLEGCINTHDDD